MTMDDQTGAALAVTQGERKSWRCFHCDELFIDEGCARLHFGVDFDSAPACQIKAGAEGSLLRALRDAEQEATIARQAIADECTEAARAHYAQMTRHHQSLIAAEELGFERGIADMQAALTTARADALEEAARIAEAYADDVLCQDGEDLIIKQIATAIRAAREGKAS